MKQLVCHNGQFHPADAPLITVQNRCFKYGDGVFETMKCIRGRIPLFSHHMERLFASLKMLGIETPNLTPDKLLGNITALAEYNNCRSLARARLATFRNDANEADYVIEIHGLDEEVNRLNEEGLVIDIFPHCRKSCDAFSNLKTANFLPYVLAGMDAASKGVNDCIVLNSENNICDTSKANLFIFKEGELLTPALHQGCVNGVMRKFVIDYAKKHGYNVHQTFVPEENLLTADEVFLTNAVFGIRWVRKFRELEYGSRNVKALSELFNKTFTDDK